MIDHNHCDSPSSLEDCEAQAYIACMSARGLLPVLPVFLVSIPSVFGQVPKRVEKCLPYPTLAQEIREMQPTDPVQPRVRVHVIRVEFDLKDGIPANVQEEISKDLQSHTFERDADIAYVNDLANEIAEVGVGGAFRNSGYFAATAAANLRALRSEGADISVVVAVSATPGPQYRVGDIRIESADSTSLKFSPEVLRGLIPLQGGELFSVERVRAGLEKLERVYEREGYVDMTAGPETAIDETHKTIDMVLKIDQQVQYRVESIEFLGVNAVTREKLTESLPKSGQVFDGTRIEEFFELNRALLPSDASRDDVSVRRDPKSKTVAILFDFRTCPPQSK
jgi:outer membrane translocation and assembly module TamA